MGHYFFCSSSSILSTVSETKHILTLSFPSHRFVPDREFSGTDHGPRRDDPSSLRRIPSVWTSFWRRLSSTGAPRDPPPAEAPRAPPPAEAPRAPAPRGLDPTLHQQRLHEPLHQQRLQENPPPAAAPSEPSTSRGSKDYDHDKKRRKE